MLDIASLATRISAEFSSAAEKDRKSRFLQGLNYVSSQVRWVGPARVSPRILF